MRLAFQLLSRSVSNCLRLSGEVEKAEIVLIINNFMDLCNSRLRYHYNPLLCGYGLHPEKQRQCVESFRDLIENMTVNPPKPKPGKVYKKPQTERRRHTMPPFQKGLLCNIDAILTLTDDLKKAGQKYLLLSKVIGIW